MDTRAVRLTLDGVLLLRFNISSKLRLSMQSTPLSTIRRMCPFLLNLIGITTPACTRICTRTPICTTVLGLLSDSPLLVHPIGSTTTDAIRYATNAANAVDTAVTGTPDHLICAVLSNGSYQHYQHRYQHQPSFHSHGPYQGRPVLASASRDK